MRKLVKIHNIETFNAIGVLSCEMKISALSLLRYALEHNILFKRELAQAAVNFCRNFQKSHEPYAKEILDSFDKVSLADLAKIPVVPLPDEQAEFDHTGNLIP